MEEGGENQPTSDTVNDIMKAEEEDRISLLPDCLLIKIISRLPETKEAIRTGTLSKRWQHLWPYVSNLIFKFQMSSFQKLNHDHQRLSDFVSFVDKTLTQCRQFNLTKFKLSVSASPILFRFNVQDLDLTILDKYLGPEYVLDEFVFNNSCFTRLNLEGFEFSSAGAISWKNLKSLFISDAKVDDGLIMNIQSGSPLLETLSLVRCYGFGRIDITSKSVKNLVIGGYDDPLEDMEPLDIIEINAPYILSLQIIMDFLLWKVVLLNVSSLVEAELDYEKGGYYGIERKEEEEEMLEDLILSLHHVKKLQIGYNCLKTLGCLEAKGFTFPSNLEHPDWPDYDTYSSGSEDW